MVKFSCKIGDHGVFARFCGSILMESRNWESEGYILAGRTKASFKRLMDMMHLFRGREIYVDFVMEGRDEEKEAVAIKELVLSYPEMTIELVDDITECLM